MTATATGHSAPPGGGALADALADVLVVTAVTAERDAVLRALRPATDPDEPLPGTGEALPGGYLAHRVSLSPGPPSRPRTAPGRRTVDVLAVGAGPAAAAAGTATALTAAALGGRPYSLVISAGIAGGFPVAAPPAAVGAADTAPAVVVADAIVAADLGAETPEPGGFLPVTELGFGTVEHRPPARLVAATAEAAGAVTGTVLTVSTATGSAERARELAARHPGAAAEAMEGFGVAEAAAAHGVPALEVRAVSNAVGPRDRDAWRVGDALEALTTAFASLLAPLPPASATAADTPPPSTRHTEAGDVDAGPSSDAGAAAAGRTAERGTPQP